MMKKSLKKYVFFVFAAACILAGQSVHAVEFKAEKVDYDINSTETVLEENVVIKHEDQALSADKAKLNVNKK